MENSPKAHLIELHIALLEQSKVIFYDETMIGSLLTAEYPKWSPHVPVFINAPTGAGKNYFTHNELLAFTMKNGLGMLYLSNRVAVGRQEKLETCAAIKKLDYQLGTELEKQLGKYTQEGLDDFCKFGQMTIKSYQGIFSLPDTVDKEKIKIVVIDECHFFTSDAVFNTNTANILGYIVKTFPNAVRVYCSATPDSAIFHIMEAEYKVQREMEKLLPDSSFSPPSYYDDAIGKRFWPLSLHVCPPYPSFRYNGDVRANRFANFNPPHYTYNDYTAVIYNFERDYSYLKINFIDEKDHLGAMIARIEEEKERGIQDK